VRARSVIFSEKISGSQAKGMQSADYKKIMLPEIVREMGVFA
jgi:hypothetical protein